MSVILFVMCKRWIGGLETCRISFIWIRFYQRFDRRCKMQINRGFFSSHILEGIKHPKERERKKKKGYVRVMSFEIETSVVAVDVTYNTLFISSCSCHWWESTAAAVIRSAEVTGLFGIGCVTLPLMCHVNIPYVIILPPCFSQALC